MNKQTFVAFLIVTSILLLALKDTASLVHTLLHYIPNNPWHQHEEISRDTHHINPLEIHKYLQHKHGHTHSHAHDVMDHIHHNETEPNAASEELKHPIKIDCYFQSLWKFHIQQNSITNQVIHFSIYLSCTLHGGVNPLYQPPQL